MNDAIGEIIDAEAKTNVRQSDDSCNLEIKFAMQH